MKEMNMNLEQFNKHVQESDKPVLVEFWAPWCVYCRRIAPAYDKIAEQYADKLVVGKINVDDVPEAAQKEKIEAIPALLLYKGVDAVSKISEYDLLADDGIIIIETDTNENVPDEIGRYESYYWKQWRKICESSSK